MKKLLCGVVSLVLVFIMVLPVHARNPMDLFTLDIPESYDFTMSMSLAVDSNIDDATLQQILEIINEINIDFSGSADFDGMAGLMFMEMDLDIPALGLPLSFGLWFDMDFNDLENPEMVYIIEMPAMLRLLLAGVMPELSRQFLLLDMSEMLQEAMEELPELIGEIEAMMDFSEEDLEELLADLRAGFGELWAEIEDYIDFDFDFHIDTIEEDGELVALGFGFSFTLTIEEDGEYVTVDFSIEGEYFNFGNPTLIELPELTPENSLDIFEWLIESGFDFDNMGIPVIN